MCRQLCSKNCPIAPSSVITLSGHIRFFFSYILQNEIIFCLLIEWLYFHPSQGSKEDTTTLHVLGFLKDLLSALPLSSVKSCCETLLRVMTLSHVVRVQFKGYIFVFIDLSILNTCLCFSEAGNSKCNAGFPQALQQQA